VKYRTHNDRHKLENWGHCWIIQQNVNENSSSTPDVLFQQHDYPRFLELSRDCDVQIKLRLENKMKNAPPIRGQNSCIVTTVDVNINNNNNTNNSNNVNDEGFVTSLLHQILLLQIMLCL
jgi:hypothetical protein